MEYRLAPEHRFPAALDDAVAAYRWLLAQGIAARSLAVAGDLGAASPRHPYASRVFADLGGLPPLLLQVASSEVLLDDARRVHDTVRAAGGVSRLDVVDGVFHAWQMLDGLMPEAGLALHQAAAFLNEPARRPTPGSGAPPPPAAQRGG